MNCQKSKQGFTLIELLVVISIISLLSTIIFANITESRKRARDVVRLTDLRDMQIALGAYSFNGKTFLSKRKVRGSSPRGPASFNKLVTDDDIGW
jgi:prepilin-type N-terminal cleavage/methylation domain-containing protein